MDYLAMTGKLIAWYLIGHNRKVGFLIGAVASLVMMVPVYEAGLHGLTIYCLLVCAVQIRSYFRWATRNESIGLEN